MDIKDGDIFRWSYREPATGMLADYKYHCCSRIAVARNGHLRDTYWHGGSDGRFFGPDDLPRLDLTYLGNFADLDNVGEWQANYYADADIVDINHANSTRGNFYLRKGAKRCAAKMLEAARYKLAEKESAARYAASIAEELRQAIIKIEAGQIEDVHL